MLSKFSWVLPLLSLSSIISASPLLEERQTETVPPSLEVQLRTNPNDMTKLIKGIIEAVLSGQDASRATKPSPCPTSNKCCVWWDVSAELTKLFMNTDGTCNDAARAAIRLGFHDAGSWDRNQTHGGADGSLLMDFGEIDRPENNGLQDVRLLLRGVKDKFGVGYADLAQYAHNHATISCPKGPRVRTFVGRKDATQAAPTGLLPDVHDSADNLIQLFKNKGFSAHDLAALVGAHSTARQRFVDTSPAAVNKQLDTTIGVWDVEFYNDTLNNESGNNPEVFVLPSDKVLSVHPQVQDEWHEFVGDQEHWNEDYAKAFIRMSLTGVRNLRDLSDCTRTLPAARKSFP